MLEIQPVFLQQLLKCSGPGSWELFLLFIDLFYRLRFPLKRPGSRLSAPGSRFINFFYRLQLPLKRPGSRLWLCNTVTIYTNLHLPYIIYNSSLLLSIYPSIFYVFICPSILLSIYPSMIYISIYLYI